MYLLFSFILIIFGYFSQICAQENSNCITPNGESAKCIAINKCQVILKNVGNISNDVVRFLKESRCGFEENPLVCCGSVAHFTPNTKNKFDVTKHPNINILPSYSDCGHHVIPNKIYGGEDADLGEHPWMALLEYYKNGRMKHNCGGVLISSRYVLTAAHCIIGNVITINGNLIRVRLGEHNQSSPIDCQDEMDSGKITTFCAPSHLDIRVEQTIVHEQYHVNSRNRYHDIALIRLAQPVMFTEFIRPICLPLNEQRIGVGTLLTVAGWGLTEKGVLSPTKKKVTIPTVSDQECSMMYYQRYGINLAKTQMCAGGVKGRDSCKGDSGGPIMNSMPGKNNIYVEGIVSFGADDCGSDDIPGIYTRVSEYLDWILNNIRL